MKTVVMAGVSKNVDGVRQTRMIYKCLHCGKTFKVIMTTGYNCAEVISSGYCNQVCCDKQTKELNPNY